MYDPYRAIYYPDTERPDWHRKAVGGMWDEVGALQARFLSEQGLRPHHLLLDIGCGSLRAGVHLVRYLDAGNYVGTDISADLLDAGRAELAAAGLAGKGATLLLDGDFNLAATGRTFDFALAQSLFTHLPITEIARCIRAVAPILAPGGRFYATYLDAPAGVAEAPRTEIPTGLPFATYTDRDPYHQPFALLATIAADAGLAAEEIGDWGHPRGQRMILFQPRD